LIFVDLIDPNNNVVQPITYAGVEEGEIIIPIINN